MRRAPPTDPLAAAGLAAFVAVFEATTVHGAADALNLTQSAVTKRLQALERRAGVELFERGRFGMRPTGAGRLLYPEAKQALAALDHAQAVLDGHREIAGRALSLAASHTIGEFLLPGWLGEFRRLEPGMRAQIEILNSAAVLDAVRARHAPIGFVEGVDMLEGFESVVVARDTIVVVVAAGHPWARLRSIDPHRLAEEPYITRESGSGTRAVAQDALARVGVEPSPTLETASLQSIKRALLDGGYSLLSPLAVDAERREGSLCAIPLRGASLSRELRAVHDRRTHLTGLPRRFWSWLCEREGPGIARRAE